MKLIRIAEFPNFRALAWHGDELYASSGYRVFKIIAKALEGRAEPDRDYRNTGLDLIGFYRPDPLRLVASQNRFSSRLLRTGFHSLSFLNDGRMVAVVSKAIVILDEGERRFKATWHVQRGNRPRSLAVTPEGWVFWGEYLKNPQRDRIHVYGSFDRGDSWRVVYTFPAGTINHVHNILYDRWDDCLWMFTGDEGNEPKIIRANKDWSTVNVVREGSQQVRAATMIITPDHLYYATDTPHEQNCIYRMEKKTGEFHVVAETSGPAMWSCRANGAMFFSSASEPGEFYHPAACIWGSRDGDRWEKLVEWPKDRWHPRFFQFGNVVLPAGEYEENILAATGAAVKKMDSRLVLWKIEDA